MTTGGPLISHSRCKALVIAAAQTSRLCWTCAGPGGGGVQSQCGCGCGCNRGRAGGLCRLEMPLRALSGMQHKCAGVQVGGDGLGTTSNGTVQHTHSTTSVHRRECFMSPRILSPTPHGPMDASMLSSSRPRLFQTCCICADAGCCRLQS